MSDTLYFHYDMSEEAYTDIKDLFGFNVGECARFRSIDVSLVDNKGEVRGRCGGGNREGYESENSAMSRQAGFLYDEDDDYDETFAVFGYSLDEKKWKAFVEKYKMIF